MFFFKRGFAKKIAASSLDSPAPWTPIALQTKCAKLVDRLHLDLSQITIGRANPNILNNIVISHNNKKLNLLKLCQVNVKDNQTLSLNILEDDFVAVVSNAIKASGLGLNPVLAPSEGNNVLHVPIPRLSSEGRLLIKKQISSISEKIKQRLRAVRQDERQALKIAKMTKDEDRKLEKQIQDKIDNCNKEIEKISLKKQTDIENS